MAKAKQGTAQAQIAHAERAKRFALAYVTSKEQIDSSAHELGKLKLGQFEILTAALGTGDPITEAIWNAEYKAPFEKILTENDYNPKSMAPMLNRLKLFAIATTHGNKYPRLTLEGKPQSIVNYVDHYRTTLAKNGDYTPANAGNAASTRTGTGRGKVAAVEVAPEKVTKRTAAIVLLGSQVEADIEFVMSLVTQENLPKLRAIAMLLTK